MVALSATTLRPPAPAQGQESGEYVVFANVPIFDEHEAEDGVRYDARLLTAIAANCNRRIRDTGDWCPIVVGHTTDPKGDPLDPPVIGFAGPFTVGRIGTDRPRACIFTTFWVYKHALPTFRRYPRRSVEVWPEERPDQRYFDPIAILGAETPRRDLGLLYARPTPPRGKPRYSAFLPPGVERRGGVLVYAKRRPGRPMLYEAASPGGFNTFTPGGSGKRRQPTKYQEATSMPLSEQDIAQLLEAMEPKIQSMIDAAMGSPGADIGDEFGDPPADMGNPEGPADPMGADPLAGGMDPLAGPPGMGAPPADPLAGSGAPPADPLAAGGAPPAAPPSPGGLPGLGDLDAGGGPPDASAGPDPADDDEDKQAFGRMLARKFQKYAKAGDEAGAAKFLETLDADEKQMFAKGMEGCADEPAKQLYNKMAPPEPAAKPELAQQYRKQRDQYRQQAEHYRKQNAELVQRYRAAQATAELAKKEADAAKAAAWEETRRRRLTEEQTAGVVMDLDDEMAETASHTPAQFDTHVERMRTSYQRVPLTPLPVDPNTPPVMVSANDADKYDGRAMKLAESYRKNGKPGQYAKIMRALKDTRGRATDAEIDALVHSGK